MTLSDIDAKLPDAFSAAKSITHPIALVAYVAAAIMTYFIFRDINRRKTIASAKEADRADIIIKTAEKIHLDITAVPENDRAALIKQTLTNRIISQIILAVAAIIVGLIIAFIVVYQMNTQLKAGKTAELTKENIQNAEEMRKLQNAFSIKGITLEGETVNLLTDSQRLTIDWIKWFGGSPIILTSVSGTFDTLKKFARLFNYDRTDEKWKYKEEDANVLHIGQNEKEKKLRFKATYTASGILATDPNGSPEYAFTTKAREAMNILGFTKNCIANPFHDPTSDDFVLEQNDGTKSSCTEYLNQATLKWLLKNYNYKNMGDNGEDFSGLPEGEVSEVSLSSLKFYSYLTGSRFPKDFMMLRIMDTDGCVQGFDEQTVKISFSTPTLTVQALVLKNVSEATFTIDNFKFLYNDRPFLRLDSSDRKSAKKKIAYDKKIKLLKGEQLLIPIRICLNRIDKVKQLDEGIDPESTDDIYYYGKSFYLDSIGINGYEFSIGQASHDHVVKAYYNYKYYTEEGSCPYAYTLEPTSKQYELESHFIYKRNSKLKEGYDTLKLKHPSEKMAITEIDNETSFVDQLILLSRSSTGSKTYACQSNLLSKIDKKYLVMHKGDKLIVDFGKVPIDPKCNYYLVSYGYYKPYGRSYLPPKFLTVN